MEDSMRGTVALKDPAFVSEISRHAYCTWKFNRAHPTIQNASTNLCSIIGSLCKLLPDRVTMFWMLTALRQVKPLRSHLAEVR